MTTPSFSISARRPGLSGPRIVLFVEDGGGDWHARRLREALEMRGATVVTTCLKFCAFDTRLASGISIPGFDGDLPDGAFVRSVSTGSLEQITLRLGILHALRESGVRVWNDARVIERCVDKSTATFLFQKAGLPVPPTRAAEGLAAAQAFFAAEGGRPLVAKPLFGSQGNGVTRVDHPENLPEPSAVGDVYYLQRYLRRPTDTHFEDWRVFVSRGRLLSAIVRVGRTWITNVHQGASPVHVEPDEQMTDTGAHGNRRHRRRLRRCRSDPRRERPTSGFGDQFQSGLEGIAERHRRQHCLDTRGRFSGRPV